jgi:hypothetical protein
MQFDAGAIYYVVEMPNPRIYVIYRGNFSFTDFPPFGGSVLREWHIER